MIFKAESLIVDTDLYRVTRAGEQVDVEPQVFDLLVYLIQNRERVVTRNELLQVLWKGKVVSDSALSARLKAGRKAVGDTGSSQKIIKTIHGRGYQFVADITELESSGFESECEVERTTLNLPASQDRPSIVVLPFTNISDSQEQEYFADGITEDIITELSRFRDLFVIARNSSFFYKGKAVKSEDIGRDLGVAYIVEGSIRRGGGRVRITAQLVEANSGKHIWAERFDRELKDVFAVQDEITRLVASAVGARVEHVDQQRALEVSPDNLEAYDLYLHARAYFLEFNKVEITKARVCLEKAIHLDSRNAEIHAILGSLHLQEWLAYWTSDRQGSLDRALAYARRAVQLDGANSRTRWSLGEVLQYCEEYDEAYNQLRKAVDLNPNDVEALCIYGFFLVCIGEANKGLKLLDDAARIDPFDLNWRQWLHGDAFFIARRYEEAVACLSQVRDLIAEVQFFLAISYAQLERNDDARNHLSTFLDLAEQDMVHFPGRRLENWKSYCKNMGCKDLADTDHIYQSLAKAWKTLEA